MKAPEEALPTACLGIVYSRPRIIVDLGVDAGIDVPVVAAGRCD